MRFRKIAELSDITRMPRIGKIHLGIKKLSQKGMEYPAETDHFVFDGESPYYQKLIERYGKSPKELPIAFPIEETEQLFPQGLKYYGRSKGLICTGDGRIALRLAGIPIGADLKELKIEGRPEMMEELECPYKDCADYAAGRCKQMGNLFVLLPEITLAGVWQIDTSSYHSIVDLNSSLAYVRQLVGRVSMLFDPRTLRPFLTLRRVTKETHGSGRKETHWPMIVELNADLRTVLEASRTLPIASRVALPEPSREEYLIPRSVAETLPLEPEEAPVPKKPNGAAQPEPNAPPAAAKEPEKVTEPEAKRPAPAPQKPAPRKLSLF